MYKQQRISRWAMVMVLAGALAAGNSACTCKNSGGGGQQGKAVKAHPPQHPGELPRPPGPGPAKGGIKPVKEGEHILLKGFEAPESVIHDAREDVYLVSNICGSPFAKNGKGYISRVSPKGKVTLHWIGGGPKKLLDAPKGLAISGERIYVTDINQVRLFHRKTGAPETPIPVPGATFLNDIVAAEDGTLYVTDTGFTVDPKTKKMKQSGTDAIWKITAGGQASPLVKDPKLGNPNGVVLRDGHLLVVTWGTGKILQVTLQGKWSVYKTTPAKQLDGIVVLPGGALLISSWQARGVFKMDKKGKVQAVAVNLESPADIGIDRKRKRVLAPLLNRDLVQIIPIKD